ncbi:aminotransferase class IV [bacterium]|jgi:branched-chain amino acid aminotransferase|nr:hypothetical protein [Planctomicrobium sp.]MDA7503986.1 aminotransferase class IV [bacterium]
MSEIEQASRPVAYLNGELIPFSEARLPVYDLAIMQGASVTERLRTFRHQPFQVEQHLSRLHESLRLVGWKNLPNLDGLTEKIHNVCGQNSRLIDPEEDLSIVIFISAGQGTGDSNGLATNSEPTVCVYSTKLPFSRWVDGYKNGTHLVIPEIRQIPRTSLDPRIKMRSRLHWQIADQIAREQHPGAMALLLDEHDHLTETSSGNLMLVKDGVLLTPCEDATLNGMSRQNVIELCEELEVELAFQNLTALDLYQAEEAFLTSSTYCIMPVATVNGQPIGMATPGRLTQKLTQMWSEKVDLNFVAQAIEHRV